MLLGQREDPFGLAASPLGSGAIAGSSLPLDREMTAESLGFSGPTLSSIDATASRDEAMDFVYALARIGVHLSRFAEQWILYCTTEFGFVSIGSAYTTGSSMMPQKRNPDMLELIRGRAGNLIGSLTALLSICKGLPIGYNRDLQEDKRHVFSAFDTVRDCVEMSARIVRSARFNAEAIARAGGGGQAGTSGLDRGHADATSLAEYFVRQGVPFRTAHQIVGTLVRTCDARGDGLSLGGLSIEDFAKALRDHGRSADSVGSDVYQSLGFAGVIRSYATMGHAGTGPGGYRDWLRLLGEQRTSIRSDDAANARTAGSEAAKADADGSEPESVTTGDSAGEQDLFGRDASLAQRGENDEQRGEFELAALAEHGRDAHSLTSADAVLVAAYETAARTLDDLPYTNEFEALFERVSASGVPSPAFATRRSVLRRLQNLRKASKLPRVGRASSAPPALKPEDEQALASLVVAAVGSTGQRDQLPYDERFDHLAAEFNHRAGLSLSPHDIWRVIAKLAK